MKEQMLILVTTPLYLIVIGLEIFLSHLHLKKYYTVKDTLINVYLCIMNGGIDLLFSGNLYCCIALVLQISFYKLLFQSLALLDFAIYFRRPDLLY